MTKKGFIILTTILLSVVALIILLFGCVFCLRKQYVTIVDGLNLDYSNEEIISTASLENGKSIFALDKQKAIDNIEKTYPDLKVVQIKTVSVISVEIRIRTRVKMYYATSEGNYYILDEELKILSITTDESDINGLIYIDEDLGLNSNLVAGDFVGQAYFAKISESLFTSMYSVVKNEQGEYLTRDEIKDIIQSIKINHVGYDVLSIQTRAGVEIRIGKPESNLEYKINVCFAVYNKLAEGTIDNGDITHGTIKYLYDSNGVEIIGYQV